MKPVFPILLPIIGSLLSAAAADENTFRLAGELLAEREYKLSALEFRRFAMETADEDKQASSYLFSGYAYLLAGNGKTAEDMLDRADEADAASAFMKEHALLSAETARKLHDPDTALYYYETLTTDTDAKDYKTFARRRSAALYLQQGDFEAARRELEQSPADESRALQALEEYMNRSDKSPLAGGLLGLIPGAGYWYSGEVANGFRSLILNSLFLFGMVQTADDEQWGAFAVISFFEVTWYSGSVYGGIDAAQRFNRNRLETARQGIEGNLSYRPDPEVVVPLFKLNIHF